MSKVLVFGKHKSTSLTVSTIQGKKCCSSYLTDQKKKNHLPNLGFIQPKIQNKLVENSGEVTKNEDSETPVAPQKKKDLTSCTSSDKNTEFRKNEFNIQMLSKSLHRQIFGETQNSKQINPDLILKAREKLNEYGLLKNEINLLDDVSINLPPLKGKNIAQHFQAIGEEQCKPYRELVKSFIRNGLPNSPKEWLCQKGWTKYVEGEEPVSVPFPDEDIFVFDVEVCVNLGELPTLATAVSPNAWYGWICSDLAEGIASIPKNRYNTSMLIPFEGKTVSKEKPRVIVGHSVSYDRARIKEQYHLKSSALRFIDTMSMHICIGGLNRVQKNLINKTPSNEDLMSDFGKDMCLCSLKELYALYCDKDLPKEERNTFLNGSMADVKENFQNLMSYCANDVKATFEVLQAIFPVFLKRFPHPVTLAGMLEMGSAFLPVNKNWNKFLNEADQTYEDSKNEISSVISKKCDNACSLLHNEMYKEDMWMWDEDWKTHQLKLTQRIKKIKPRESQEEPEKFQQKQTEVEEDEEEKILQAKYQYLFDLKIALPKRLPFLPGYPQWYRNLCEKPDSSHWTLSPQVTTSMNITPKLLKLKWENFPLHHTQKYGWGILIPDILAENVETSVPFEKLKELTMKNCNVNLKELHKVLRKQSREIKCFPKLYYKGSAVACDYVVDNCCYFFKMPNVSGSRRNVGNPLSKEISQAFANGVLSSSDPIAKKVLDLGSKITYWRNNRQRITSQMIVWLNKKEAGIPSESDEDSLTGIIIPQVVVCGTLTRRAMESTWLTASRVTENRIGSELRAMIQTPPGYHFVGADVDSQELWIASLLGDSYSKIHGSTPLGWMTLSGTKSTGTDLHSVTAKAVGISRGHAKIINYSRIYGASTRFAQKLLKQFNPSMSEDEAWFKVDKMYKLTKGTKEFLLKNSFKEKYPSLLDFQMCDMSTAVRISKRLKKKVEDIFEKSKWINGTESAMFNRLEEIATSERPTTPFLKCRLSRALEPRFEGDDLHLRTRINWVVQSGAVDFLHLMLVCMKWLTNGKARYCFSFHDEVRYMVPSDERYNTALALHITNLLVRSFCAHSLGMHDLPQSVAFFSAVEIDKALRKEANDDCVTASNPHGLQKEYGVGPGETLNIYEAIEKTGGKLASFETTKKIVSSNCSAEILEKKTEMSQATKRKHVYREVLQGELEPPKENQQIVKVLGSKGSNLHLVETTDCTAFLVSMPNKFRNNVWIKRGDFVYIEPIEGSGKVKAEIVNILTSDHIKYLKKEGFWPSEFSKKTDEGETDDEKDFF